MIQVRAGVDVIITQVVYSADVFLEYLHSCRALTIQIPIIPGLYIPPDFNQLKRMIQITKIRLPEEIYAEFKKHRNDITAFHRFSILFTLNIIRKIVRNCPEYVPGFHFFTLNNFSMIQKLLEFKDYWDKQL